MRKIFCFAILISLLTIFIGGCYNTERHARRLQESFENIFLDGSGIN